MQYVNKPFTAVVSEGVMVASTRFLYYISKDNQKIALKPNDVESMSEMLTLELEFIEI